MSDICEVTFHSCCRQKTKEGSIISKPWNGSAIYCRASTEHNQILID